MKFDFSNYPYSGVDGAKVHIYVDAESTSDSAFAAHLYGITNNTWDASTMTWNSGSPNHDGVNVTGTLGTDYFLAFSGPSYDPIQTVQYYDFDATES